MPERSITDIGKYKILAVVGEGAMGVVYRATDSVLNRTVAIKVMSESIARQQDLRDRFLREAQAAGSMQHPNIVSIYDLGEMDGHLYIAMEFVEGVDLETVIAQREPLTLQAKLDIIIDVLAGLAYAHKRGIVHRDIKPANIRITEDGRAKIMDFGIAHLSSSTMTRTGMVVGTPAYMAPEQITGAHTAPATDLFAVGAVLYELLTGLKAFAAPTLQSLFFKIVSEPPVSIVALLPGLPEALNQIVDKALEKNPADRYAGALEMANDLTKVRATLSGAQHPGTVSLTATVAQAIAEKQRAGRRTRQLASGGGVLALAAVALIWFTISRRNQPPLEAEPLRQVNPSPAVGGIAANQHSDAGGDAPITPSPATSAPGNPQNSSLRRPPTPSSDQATSSGSSSKNPVRKSRPDAALNSKKIVPPPLSAAQSRSLRPQPLIATGNAKQTVVRNQTSPNPAITGQGVAPAPTPAPAPPAPAPSPVAPPAPSSIPASTQAAAPSATGVRNAVEEYARAIESREIDEVRRVYPNLTAAEQSNLERFFHAARRINVNFRVSSLELNGASAETRLVGTYDYVNAEGRPMPTEHVTLTAIFKHNGSVWRLMSVR